VKDANVTNYIVDIITLKNNKIIFLYTPAAAMASDALLPSAVDCGDKGILKNSLIFLLRYNTNVT